VTGNEPTVTCQYATFITRRYVMNVRCLTFDPVLDLNGPRKRFRWFVCVVVER